MAIDIEGGVMGDVKHAPGEWQPIETAPQPHAWLRHSGTFLIACLHEHRDEDSELTGETSLLWAHAVYLGSSGWMLSSSGFKGLHGNCSFPINDNATHWMLLPEVRPHSAKATGEQA